MTPYFRQLPNFDYVNRFSDAKISDYIQIKNIFKRGKIREDVFQNLTFFEKYNIIGNERPDNVAYKIYGESTLDWVILLSNNILNIQSEWPMPQEIFDEYLISKYGDYDTLYSDIHHYETQEVRNSQNVIIVPGGLQVGSNFSTNYFDYGLYEQIDTGNISIPITNYDYEIRLDNKKRNIYILKSRYLNIVLSDMESMMSYQKGSTQYVSENLVRGDNIRLYT